MYSGSPNTMYFNVACGTNIASISAGSATVMTGTPC